MVQPVVRETLWLPILEFVLGVFQHRSQAVVVVGPAREHLMSQRLLNSGCLKEVKQWCRSLEMCSLSMGLVGGSKYFEELIWIGTFVGPSSPRHLI